MIGFVDALLYNLSESQSIITSHSRWLPKTSSIPYWTTTVFILVFLLLWLTGFWFTNQLRMTKTNHLRITKDEWIVLRVRVMLRSTISRPVCLGIKHPCGAFDQVFITVIQLRVCWYGTLSLTRGRVCLLQCTICLRFTCYLAVLIH
jgi:hypothetical protein